MKLLENKNVLITGASRGIGRSIALTCAQNGANIFFVDLREDENSASLINEVQAMGLKCGFMAANVASYEESEKAVKTAVEVLGSVDVLVNNAGITKDGLLLRMTPDQWNAVINVNLTSVYNFCRAVAPYMMKKRSGSIVNISSIVGLTGNAGQCNYSASKAGIVGFTRSMAKELGSRGIRSNAVAPGFIQTAMTDALSPEVMEKWNEAIPLHRPGLPQDVANTVVLLASDMASYITGQVICCDGGLAL